MTIDDQYGVVVDAEVGEIVWDDLERKNARIVRKEADTHGNIGYWLASEWLGGGRFPWEISQPRVSYEIGADASGLRWIKCFLCGLVSYNANDVEQLYCGCCGRFHQREGKPEP